MNTPSPTGNVVRFGAFELDLRARELRKDGRSTGLREQSVRILALLLEKPGEVVLREEIRKTLWPNDTLVEFDQSINAAIKRLRQALDDSADQPKYIETLARRGYRWMVPVQWGESALAGTNVSAGPPPDTVSSAGNLVGKKVSHYRILEVLGGGGMGVVYKAEDIKLGRRVALKFLPEEVAGEPSALGRFEREARAASALDHPNICTIHEFGENEGQPFIVMPLLEGQTLRERIGAQPPQPGKPLPTAELLSFAVQITRGLEAAHQNGIIHRDIKPANIFITNRGEAKILDFGVAKLIHGDARLGVAPAESENTTSELVHASFSLNLTRTGTTVGTASYMSPEQILGEELDARTDIFSFGLVLHEMATGHQAFGGETAENIREAILHRLVQPARQLNPELPSKFDGVLNKALVKDRNDRYQHASELRADLEGLQPGIAPRARTRWRELALAAVALLLIASALFWFNRRPLASPAVLHELKLRQLTNNSADHGVGTGAISGDGKYIAYTDAKGIRIQLVETGESHAVPQPEGLKPEEVGWDIAGWSPDSTRFLVNAHPPEQDAEKVNSQGSSIWVVSVLGGAPRKLRDNATAGAPSPDGALVPFTTNKGRVGDREIWAMEPNGEHARILCDAGEGSSVGYVVWSPDGQRILYTILDDSGGTTLVDRDLKGGTPVKVLPTSAIDFSADYLWLPDGRLIYTVNEPGAVGQATTNYWQMRLNASTGEPTEKPRRLTNWAGFRITYSSATADGKRLTFRKMAGQITTYVADLDPSGRGIANVKHFSLTDSWDFPWDWTPDSRTIIMVSNRTGPYGIYKQSLNEDTAKLLASGLSHLWHVVVSPDGVWVLYIGSPEQGDLSGTASLMRVPISGGPPELISRVRNGSFILRARAPSNLCAIAEPAEDRKQMVITAFDPIKGLGPEMTRFATDPTKELQDLSISPDATKLAIIRTPEEPIQIMSLRGEAPHEIAQKDWKRPERVDWAADGKGLFISAAMTWGTTLLYLDLHGNARVFWKGLGGGYPVVRVSPDGRHLAFAHWTADSNMWLMENF